MKRPNILWFISDDTSACMQGCNGGRVLSPTIDSVAEKGVVLDNFFCASPACTPSRYTYLTGRYGGRCPTVIEQGPADEPHRVFFNTVLDPGRESSIADRLRRAGYRTGHVGKWHVHGHPERVAAIPAIDPQADLRCVNDQLRRQQDHLRGIVREAGFDYAASVVWGNHESLPLAARQHNLEWTTRGALDFIEESATRQPFFLSMATTTIHGPNHIGSLLADPYLTGGGYSEDHLGCQASRASIYQRLSEARLPFNSTTAGVLWMDDALAAVLARLRDLGLADDTVVIVSTDHGPSDGGKFTLYEAGVRIPFAIHWPGVIEGGKRLDGLAQSVDLLPTLLQIAGAAAPTDSDGRSLLPMLTGEQAEVHDAIYGEFGYARSVRTRRWKYIAWRPPKALQGRLVTHFGRDIQLAPPRPNLVTASLLRYPHYVAADQLYDLDQDPEEQHNLARDPACQDILAELRQRLRGFLDSMQRPFPLDDAPGPLSPALQQELACSLQRQAGACRQDLHDIGFESKLQQALAGGSEPG